jgi:hypothetical protein
MEVFIRGVPPRETEKSLNNFFGDVLSRLNIEDWICQKIPRKPFAKLIFLESEDGERFLNLHGQTKAAYGRNFLPPSTINLTFKGRSLSCSRGREVDIFAIRSLEMDREARAKDNTTPVKADTEDFRTLRCTSLSCGIWDYTQSGVVFLPFFTSETPATITFKSKTIVVETDISQRLEIISQTVESVVWEASSIDAMALTLREAPRISVLTQITRLEDLNSLFDSLFADNRDVPDRNRVPGLDKYHEEIAGSCLVYRFMISKGSGLKDPTKSLGLTRGLPSMVRRNIMINQPSAPYAAQFRTLLQDLSPMSTTLPFGVRFQLQKLAQNGYLSPLKVIGLLPEVKRVFARSDSRVCVNAIRRLFRHIPYAGPDTEAKYFSLHLLTAFLRQIEFELRRGGLYSNEPMPSDQVAIIHKATVTPSGVYLDGPDGECNNRVLRKYAGHHDFFLRVQFCDEDGLPVQYNWDISNKPIFERFKTILNKGFPIAGQHFSFLGFSHSSLRSQSCWFMAPFSYNGSLIYHNDLIKDLGNFSGIRTPARCAARIGQAFSDTRDAITFAAGIVKDNNELPDVERNGRVFSDGVGTISQRALELIWGKLPPGRRPTVLQIRYQGMSLEFRILLVLCVQDSLYRRSILLRTMDPSSNLRAGAKGVIALDSRLKGESMFIRRSMTKFRGSTSNDVEICTAAYKANELRLNEQLVKILEDMGVRPQFFLNLQAEEIERLRSTTASTKEASKFVESQSIGDKINLPGFLRKLPQLQLSFQDDNFLTDVVEAAVLIQLRTLKYKARIPVKDGFTLLGIMDETGILEEGEIFCIVDMGGRGRVITGENGQPVIITRSPALHPGDVQLATAIAVPEDSPLMQLRNCICFSQNGSRDLPSKLSGGDLDGDTFHIIFDPNARTQESFEPADYARQAPRELDRPVKRQDMADFFVDFMETDQLGRICNVHKMLADQSEEGVNDERCIKLAGMASTAVDFSKTGIPVCFRFYSLLSSS